MDKKAIAYVGLCPHCHSIQKYDSDKSVPCSICGKPLPSWKDKIRMQEETNMGGEN